jgi:predicted ArsR family transcriptional regulator
MRQIEMFTRPRVARRSDPETSQMAARAVADRLPGMQAWALRIVDEFPRQTVNEMAAAIDLRDPRRIGRRLSELEKKGRIRCAGVRACSITGRPSQTYEVVR